MEVGDYARRPKPMQVIDTARTVGPMRQGPVSVRLSVCPICRGWFAAVGPAGWRYRLVAAAAWRRSSDARRHAARRRSAANASSVTLSADVES